ncbi:hypothetical protein AB6A40_003101 [Gnathostoma spinigerum]|uniref:Threonylcarbamoyl-AMP synthase n=1 Tax=Gnathostoma spinigerum TaxID=75299 RepID=A0ABD6EAU1_9BILA
MAFESILKLSEVALDEALSRTCAVLKCNGIIALPTDTLYGISTSLENAEKLYDVKHRSHMKPLGLFLSDASEAMRWAKVTVDAHILHRLLPGPVTLIFERSSNLPASLNPECRDIGLRVPDHEFVRALCRDFGSPLAQTSANESGMPSPISVTEFSELWPKIDLIVDGGILSVGCADKKARAGSTVVNLTIPGTYSIIRDGCARLRTEEILRDCGLTAITDGETRKN